MSLSERIVEVELSQLGWFVGLLAVFTALAHLAPAKAGQKAFREGWRVDATYWFVLPLLYAPLSLVLTALVLHIAEGGDATAVRELLGAGRAPFNGWPIWVQFLAVLMLSDLLQYAWHRAFHGKRLWKWHAIHHMPRELDWLSSARFHPFNTLVSFMLTASLITAIGFAPEVFLYLAPFNVAYSALVHANLNWSFGPLKSVLASPIFHRWHHTSPSLGGDKNFAPTFAFIDVIFGTYYMPENDHPDAHEFGVKDDISHTSFIKQMLWPFTVKKQ